LIRSGDVAVRSLPLLLVANSSSRRLKITNFAQIKPNSTITKRVTIASNINLLIISGTETTDEGIEATPCLAERTRTRRWRVWHTIERTRWIVNLGLAKLIKVVKEIKNM
jgi:hypothetical protein